MGHVFRLQSYKEGSYFFLLSLFYSLCNIQIEMKRGMVFMWMKCRFELKISERFYFWRKYKRLIDLGMKTGFGISYYVSFLKLNELNV